MFDPKTLDQLAQALVARMLPHIQNGKNEQPKIVQRRFTVKQAADYLGISVSALYHLVSKREIPFVKHGASLGFLKDDLDHWLEGDRV